MDLNNLKNKLLSALGQATDGARDLAGKAGEGAKNLADKAKDMGRIAKLNMEIATEKENMKKAFAEIGRLYYEAHGDAPEGSFAQLCEEVALAEKNVAEKEAEIAALKQNDAEPDISVEFEEVVAADEAAEGCCCAAKEAVEDAVEDVKDAAADCCCAAKEAVEDAVEDVKDAVEDAKDAVDDLKA